MIDKIVDAAISMFILGAIGVAGLAYFYQASTTSIPATVTGLFVLVGIFFILGVALSFYYLIKNRGSK
jgi:hypothetical protein